MYLPSTLPLPHTTPVRSMYKLWPYAKGRAEEQTKS